jgi:hypothetical protein
LIENVTLAEGLPTSPEALYIERVQEIIPLNDINRLTNLLQECKLQYDMGYRDLDIFKMLETEDKYAKMGGLRMYNESFRRFSRTGWMDNSCMDRYVMMCMERIKKWNFKYINESQFLKNIIYFILM